MTAAQDSSALLFALLGSAATVLFRRMQATKLVRNNTHEQAASDTPVLLLWGSSGLLWPNLLLNKPHQVK
jgi:hypothetical protein